MQLNQALFMLAGGSGYVPQPDVMRDDAFDPFEKDTLSVEPIIIQLQVCALPPPSQSLAFLLLLCVTVVLLSPSSPPTLPAASGAGSSPPAQERPQHRVSLRGGGDLRRRLRQLQVQDGRRG